jgi:hypothetical protein
MQQQQQQLCQVPLLLLLPALQSRLRQHLPPLLLLLRLLRAVQALLGLVCLLLLFCLQQRCSCSRIAW